MILKKVSIEDNLNSNPKVKKISLGDNISSHPKVKKISLEDDDNVGYGKIKKIAFEDDLCLQCEFKERDYSFIRIVKLPKVSVSNLGFEECCYTNLVLAHKTELEVWKNDYVSFYFKKQISTDTCDFVLKELSTGTDFIISDDTYGSYFDFGGHSSQVGLKTFKIEWRKVLILLGEGSYELEKQMVIGGTVINELSNTFVLEEFTNKKADKTVRLDCVMNGFMVDLDVDFKGVNYMTSVRFGGYFGNEKVKYVQDNIVKRDYSVEQVSMSKESEFKLQSNLLPECITEEIYDFLLFGNEMYISDYNLANHSYKYRNFAVELNSNKGEKYYVNRRSSRLNLTFKGRVKNNRKLNC